MFLKKAKMVLGVLVLLLAAHSAAYAVPTDFTIGELKFQGLQAKGTYSYSCLPAASLNSVGDFSDLRLRMSVNAKLAPNILSTLKVKVDKYRMPFTAGLDGDNAVIINALNLFPATSHTVEIDGLQIDLTSLAINSLVTGSIGISGTNINPVNFSTFYGITTQSGGEGSAVLAGDFTRLISPKTYLNSKFYDLDFAVDTKFNLRLNAALEYKFNRDGHTSNYIWQANDGYRLTFGNLSFGSNKYYLTAKYDPTALSFAPENFGLGVPASDTNASNFAAATSVIGHELNQLAGLSSTVLGVVQQHTSNVTLPCTQGGTLGITFHSPTSIQNTFTGCNGLLPGLTVDGGLWFWTDSNTWATDEVRLRGSVVGGSEDITHKNMFATGVQMGSMYTGTISGTSTGSILIGSNGISANHTFANLNFNTTLGPTATTLNVLSGWAMSDCVNTWYAPVISNWQNDSQGPIAGSFYINSLNGGTIVGAAFAAGGASIVTSDTAVVETHSNNADLERFCPGSALPPVNGFRDGTYSLSCLGGCGEANPSVATVTGGGTNIMWNNFGGSIARFLATGNVATLTGTPPPLFGTPANTLTLTLNGTQWTIHGTDSTGSCTSTCQ